MRSVSTSEQHVLYYKRIGSVVDTSTVFACRIYDVMVAQVANEERLTKAITVSYLLHSLLSVSIWVER